MKAVSPRERGLAIKPDMTPSELIQHRIVTLVELLLKVRGPKKIDLAHQLGIDAAQLSHRLKGRDRFQVHEVVYLALYYELSTDVFLLHSPERKALIDGLAGEAVARAR
jgi:hypothetical protein